MKQFRFFVAFVCLIAANLVAQQPRVVMRSIHAMARAEFDQGPVSPSLRMEGMTVVLKRTTAQQAEIERLLVEQQDPASPNFHRWLTPEEYADRFGRSQAELDRVSGWLRAEGFTIGRAARGRNWLTFSGAAANVQRSFHTQIHRYAAGGKARYANAAPASIPADLSDLIFTVGGLDDFPAEWQGYERAAATNAAAANHTLTPSSIATIYNLSPLYGAGIDGTGQKIVIVGQTQINADDMQQFRTNYNLAAQDLQTILVPDHPDPGTVSSGLGEAALDIEWSGAVAPGATIVYVYSTNAYVAAQYAIDQKLAPIISASFSAGCEARDWVNVGFFQYLAQQANVQGITWVNSAGDAGGAGCELNGAPLAQNGLSARYPASVPEVTAVGGTRFDEQGGNYWSTSTAVKKSTALSYIPEVAWNDVAEEGALWAGGGGASAIFRKPVWQDAPGVPNADSRYVPDVAMAASLAHDGYSTYHDNSYWIAGGTSAAAPVFAGVLALLNQYLVQTKAIAQAGLANVNPSLYRIARNTTNVFHDVTGGGNKVPCAASTADCVDGLLGFNSGPGYDLATGLGSVDVTNLVHEWSNQPATKAAVVVSIDPNPVYQDPDGTWHYTLTVSEEAGIAAKLTDVTIDGASYADQLQSWFGGPDIGAGKNVTVDLQAKNLTTPKTRTFTFTGTDANGTAWTQSVPVVFLGPVVAPKVQGVTNAASYQQAAAPGMILSVFGSDLASGVQQAAVVPLNSYLQGISGRINGVRAPLYFVSPGQINLQVPYETQPGTATLVLSNGHTTSSYDFQVAAAAPGIFTDGGGFTVPFTRGKRGDVLILFITGEGAVTPSLGTGQTPSPSTPVTRLPKPKQDVTMTIGGVPATLYFSGIPSGLVGVTQINFQVPADAPLGVQSVVVKIGDTASLPAKLTVTQ